MILKRYFRSSAIAYGKTLSPDPKLPKKTKKDTLSISQFFIDHKTTRVKGGNGGDGLVSFMHLKGNEFAGPDGGDGGNGGHVIFKIEPGLKSLNKIQSIYEAENGEEGRSFHMKGKSGQHLVIKVPVGTIFRSDNGHIIEELNEKKTMFVSARGGAGGKGNHYYLSNDNKRPTQFESGHKGEQFVYDLELKLIADAALIGYPNVGKSSLLNALTRARAKIGDYSFTTLHPHVGVVEYEDFKQISIADLPGILPDLTRGLGTKYLHHLEKCKILIFVIDLSLNPEQQFKDMTRVLDIFDSSLLQKKPKIVIGHKIDNQVSKDNFALLKEKIQLPIVPMSAQKKINLSKFLKILRHVYDKYGN
ncbi:mitochondrial ribosome-associated GTPase 2 [Brachionus plicatilis]|uniref:Mitochondrial ribosome-associated GTPase 2 n=1 Tax=Brachionus plicatilis TaxID=10195 RepID=A0A3M7RQQ2_BRAPC|nr:mitochondrial ribosome-associated GTPase 2 [Brachionus plicatilis]